MSKSALVLLAVALLATPLLAQGVKVTLTAVGEGDLDALREERRGEKGDGEKNERGLGHRDPPDYEALGLSILSAPAERFLQIGVELLERLGDDLRVGHRGHEVRVAVPARDDVEVKVAGDPGARGAADVEADVVALRVHEPVERLLHENELIEELLALRGREDGELRLVGERGDEQMPARVGKTVEEGEAVISPVGDQILAILPGVFRVVAEKAADVQIGRASC